ncbi:polysialyltransferase family glycosyltransferase [Flavobacterium croceum]|uniref:polysialyltransferase family glycosyltransferase n=1 Tax=Flavobacterium croceum TaxID=370975 RepID=UPI0024AA0148|nr:polysialyltransferase family glycosyltransferase [Flavobacterium croceum]
MKKAVIVAQTPFQLYISIIISTLIDTPIDLWLIDSHMYSYFNKAKKMGIWNNVYFANSQLKTNKIYHLYNIIKQQRVIKSYLKFNRPNVVVVFADNNELCATFIKYGKKYNQSKNILVEEGVAVYYSPYRVNAPFYKKSIRTILNISNPNGYTIGWSKDVDCVVLSNKNKAHPQYIKNKEVIEWPKTQYPAFANNFFMDNNDIDTTLENAILYLGQPLVEEGIVDINEEFEFLEFLNNNFQKIYIKPHPFESIEKYKSFTNISIVPKKWTSIPAEVLFSIIKPSLIISYSSSANVNFSKRYNKKSIFFIPKSMPPEYINDLEINFKNDDNILFIHNLNELKKSMLEVQPEPQRTNLNEKEIEKNWKKVVLELFKID